MNISDDDIIISRNGDGSITLSYLHRNRFIERTYMFYTLREAKKLFKEFLKEKVWEII